MAPRTFFFLINIALVLASCAAEKDELVGSAPPTEAVGGPNRTDRITLEKAAPVRPTNNPEALVTIDGWPFQEETRRFTLTWNSGNEPVVLVDIPSLNSLPVAEATFKPGEIIRWTQTHVGIYRPSVYRVKQSAELEGYIWGSGFRTGGEEFYAELKKGEQVFLYHYLGNGLCLMQVRQKLIEALCPSADNFAGNFKGTDAPMMFQPAERIWWVYLGTSTQGGWMPVDNRFIVDIE